MRLTFIFLLVFYANGYCQEVSQKPLLPNATKQETKNWIASKFKYHIYTQTFTAGTDNHTYKFEHYKEDKITILEQLDFREGHGPEKKYHYYILQLSKIENVVFNK